MFIKKIVIDNFRIYKGKNVIEFDLDEEKNISIISGNNGFGKTTFLMSLVWCLYGKNMGMVDEMYRQEILEKGGYPKYIDSSLNRISKANNETTFSVAITFQDVKIPDITCNEVEIIRTCNVSRNNDILTILIDGQVNELLSDILSVDNKDGNENFIREFILPTEIAKFFFFDAEKIVALAEPKIDNEKRLDISKAYTEVLGIKKYEDLKDKLYIIAQDCKEKSAKHTDKIELNNLNTHIDNLNIELESIENKIKDVSSLKNEYLQRSEEIQQKLIKENNKITLEELNQFKENQLQLKEKRAELFDKLKESQELIPFTFVGELLLNLKNQIELEFKSKTLSINKSNVEDKINNILNELELLKKNTTFMIPVNVRDFYENNMKLLINKYFSDNNEDNSEIIDVNIIHDFSDNVIREFNNLINTLKFDFKSQIEQLSDEYERINREINKINRQIMDAEKNTEDDNVKLLREKKNDLNNLVKSKEEEIAILYEQKGALQSDIINSRKKLDALLLNIETASEYTDKYNKTIEIYDTLKQFIKTFKDDKKRSLENRVLKELINLLHKKDFITRVSVEIHDNGNDVDIVLFDSRDKPISKSSLSMGERQLYASALLKGLVDESNILFPVFIDSPLQKFDKTHALNIIQNFYPNVSHQVVLFPLIHKELTSDEYQNLLPNIKNCTIIQNISNDESKFLSIDPNNLFEIYNNMYAN